VAQCARGGSPVRGESGRGAAQLTLGACRWSITCPDALKSTGQRSRLRCRASARFEVTRSAAASACRSKRNQCRHFCSRLDSLSITSELIRAARALLRWEQRDLAHASGVSLPTIKRDSSPPREFWRPTVPLLRRSDVLLESAGIEFTKGNGPGVHLKAAS
jgi:hypothetical protein